MSSGALERISQARMALEAAGSLDEVLAIRDKAVAVATYLKAAKESLAVQNQAASIKVHAERKAGEMIAAMDKAKNQHSAGNTLLPATKREQLDDLGLSKMAAKRLEDMAIVPIEFFEQLASPDLATAAEREITSASIQRLGAKLKREAKAEAEPIEPEYPDPEYFDSDEDDEVFSSDNIPPSRLMAILDAIRAMEYHELSIVLDAVADEIEKRKRQ